MALSARARDVLAVGMAFATLTAFVEICWQHYYGYSPIVTFVHLLFPS